MRTLQVVSALVCVACASSTAVAQSDSVEKSKFGAEDQAGRSNMMGPDMTKKAMAFIKQG